MARLWGSSEGLGLGRNSFITQAPECPIWFCLAFGPVAGNLLAFPAGPSESSCWSLPHAFRAPAERTLRPTVLRYTVIVYISPVKQVLIYNQKLSGSAPA